MNKVITYPTPCFMSENKIYFISWEILMINVRPENHMTIATTPGLSHGDTLSIKETRYMYVESTIQVHNINRIFALRNWLSILISQWRYKLGPDRSIHVYRHQWI